MSILGRPVQIAYSARGTDTLEEAASEFRQRTSCGPFVFAHHIEIASCTINGVTSTFDHSSAYGWWGEMAFAPHLLHTLATLRQGRVEIVFHSPVPVDRFASRKELAAHCEAVIRAGHAQALARAAV
mgnify:CR=1 FL=1